jgi:hypothetical protein
MSDCTGIIVNPNAIVSEINRDTEAEFEWIKTDCRTNTEVSRSTYMGLATVDRHRSQGYSIPGFKKYLKRGCLIPATPWQSFQVTGEQSGSGSNCYDSGYGYRAEGGAGWCPLTDWILTEDDMVSFAKNANTSEAVQAAIAQLWSTGWDALTFIAEFRQALTMLTEALPRVWEAWLRTQEAKRRLGFNARDSAGWWLEVQYRWRPLIRDLEAIIELLTGSRKEVSRQTRKVQRQPGPSGVGTFEVIYTPTTNPLTGYTSALKTTVDTATVSVRGFVAADFAAQAITLSVARTGWELIPYSFIVDAYIGISQAICASEVLMRAKTLVSSAGIMVVAQREMRIVCTTPKASGYSSSFQQVGNSTAVYTQRMPQSYVNGLEWKSGLDIDGFRNLLMLILQRFRRPRMF